MNINFIENELLNLLEVFLRKLLKRDNLPVEIIRNENGSSFILKAFQNKPNEIILTCLNGDPVIYLTIGNNNTLEIPIEGGRYTEQNNENELLLVLDSLISLGFEETITTKNNVITNSIIKIPLNNGETPIILKTDNYNELFSNFKSYFFGIKEVTLNIYVPYLKSEMIIG